MRVLGAVQKSISLGLVGLAAFFSLATAKEPEPQRVPTLKMQTKVPDAVFLKQHLAHKGQDCQGELPVLRGAVPKTGKTLVLLRLAGDKAVPYSFFAEALTARAQKHCADGLSILTAEPSSSSSGFDAVTAAAWVRIQTPERATHIEEASAGSLGTGLKNATASDAGLDLKMLQEQKEPDEF